MSDRTINRARQATLEDVRPVVHLLDLMHDEQAEEPTINATHEALLGDILTQPGRKLLVIEDDNGVLVGTVDIIITKNLSRNMSPWAIVENLVVHPDSRGKGYGRTLMEQAIEVAAQAGCYKVQLISNNTRHEAHGLYRSLGFTADVSGFRRYLDSVHQI